MMLGGVAGGMAWAAIPALLKSRFNTNEILTSLMLTYVATQLLIYLVSGPWRDPEGMNFPISAMFVDQALFPRLYGDWHWAWLKGTRHQRVGVPDRDRDSARVGLHEEELRGLPDERRRPRAARRALRRLLRQEDHLDLAPALAAVSRASPAWAKSPVRSASCRPSWSPGYGFTAIIVVFVGRLHPIGIVLASLLMALLYLGGEAVQTSLQLPQALAGVFQGLLLFCLLGCDLFVNYRVRRRVSAHHAASS